MIFSEKIKLTLSNICENHFQQRIQNPNLELYKGEKFGHYSSSISYELSKKVGKKPTDTADILIEAFTSSDLGTYFSKIENVNGFINFYLNDFFILEEIQKEINKDIFGTGKSLENKKVLVEHTDPNPFKLFHIGHFMTNALGEAVYRLIKNQGAETLNICYQGDVGIHIAKTVFGLLHFISNKNYSLEEFLNFDTNKTIEEFGKAYVLGSQKYKEDEESKLKIQDLNSLIFTISQEIPLNEGIQIVNKYQDSKFYEYEDIKKIYYKGRKDSLDYFESIYKKLGSKFDDYFFESITSEIGTKIIKESPLFHISEGAIIWDGKEIGHNVQVLINSFGIPTYGAKEIGLNLQKKNKYKPDLSVVCTAREQEFYFKDLIEIFKQLGFSQETIHLPHGELRLTSGKMSSRTGEVITLDEIINQITQHIIINFSSKKSQKFLESISEKIAISSLKYLILKNSIGSNIIYDPEKITDLNGNTGSYLQYTYARCQSVIKKAGIINLNTQYELSDFEKDLIISFFMFPEITKKAALEFSPVILTNYLHDIAKKFNLFYNDYKILDENVELRNFRVYLCLINSYILKKGLDLLGIEPLEEI